MKMLGEEEGKVELYMKILEKEGNMEILDKEGVSSGDGCDRGSWIDWVVKNLMNIGGRWRTCDSLEGYEGKHQFSKRFDKVLMVAFNDETLRQQWVL